MIIALTGRAGAGKSLAAAHLAEWHGFARIRFAGPLKAMVRAFLWESGVPAAEIERMVEGDRKELPAPELGGASPRRVMQTLGTEWGRELIRRTLWVDAFTAAARSALARGVAGVVVEDCRFENEAAAVRALGGMVLRIERPGVAACDGTHVSEAGIAEVVTVLNDATPDVLFQRIGVAIGTARAAA